MLQSADNDSVGRSGGYALDAALFTGRTPLFPTPV